MLKKKIVYPNKTYGYLYPTVRYYGEDLIYYLQKLNVIGVFLNDFNLKKRFNSCLHIVICKERPHVNTDSYGYFLERFINWISYKDYYKYSYLRKDKDVESIIIVLKFPKNKMMSLTNFTKKKYKNMYSQEELNFIYSDCRLVKRFMIDNYLKVLSGLNNCENKCVEYLE